jgi:hypothetical protein
VQAMNGLYITLPSISTRTFWKCAKIQSGVSGGVISINTKIPFRDLQIELGWYRITKIRFSGNWSSFDYNRVIANTSDETILSTYANIVDNYGQSVLDGKLDVTEYFELDWPKYWNNNKDVNGLNFQIRLNLIPDASIIATYGDIFETRCFIQLQSFQNEHWIKAIQGEKI